MNDNHVIVVRQLGATFRIQSKLVMLKLPQITIFQVPHLQFLNNEIVTGMMAKARIK
jgi:hypothetical protein